MTAMVVDHSSELAALGTALAEARAYL